MSWILAICTNSWILCGQYREIEYPSKSDCYEAMELLYKNSRQNDLKYVLCKPKMEGKK